MMFLMSMRMALRAPLMALGGVLMVIKKRQRAGLDFTGLDSRHIFDCGPGHGQRHPPVI